MYSSILRPANVPSNTPILLTSPRATTEAILSKVVMAVGATISHRAMVNREVTSKVGMHSSHRHRSRRVITKQWSTALLVL